MPENEISHSRRGPVAVDAAGAVRSGRTRSISRNGRECGIRRRGAAHGKERRMTPRPRFGPMRMNAGRSDMPGGSDAPAARQGTR